MLATILAEYGIWAIVLPLAVSFALCLAILATRSLHLHKTARAQDTRSVQAAHKVPTPRIGGIAVLAGVAVGLSIFAADPAALLILASTMPVFIAGLAEDMGRAVSPRARLVSAASSALMAVVLLQTWIWRTDIALLDPVFAIMPLGVLITVAWGAGISHSVNLIDGLNGLASGATVLIAAGLASIATAVGDTFIAYAAFCVMAATLGFLAFNWPFGKVFLGDAGAYSLGHLLSWLAILLAARNPDVSILALTLLFTWLLFDTFFAIYRRRRSGRRFDQPDRLHFHQLVMRALEIFVFGRSRRGVTNPLASLILMPLIGGPVLAAVWFHQAPYVALASGIGFVVLFVLIYRTGIALVRNKPALASALRVPPIDHYGPAE